MANYTESQKQNALNLYLKDANVARIEGMTGITRATLHNWMKKGEMTGGVSWQVYRKETREVELQQTRTAELEKVASGERQYLEQVKHDLREVVYEQVIAKFRDGNFDAKVGDVTEIVKLYNMLENGAAEKIAFGRYFVGKIMEITFDILTEKQFAELKAKVTGLQVEVEAKLNPLSVAHTFV